jgi:hypothetical protein
VRQTEGFLAVAFEATESVEHDLLIRKLFTSRFQTTNVKVSTWSATIAMLRSIWSARVELPAEFLAPTADASVPLTKAAMATDKLPPESLVVSPRPRAREITNLARCRRSIAA